MSRRVGLMIGILTTVVFLGLGLTLLGEDRGRIGALLLALGALRGAYVFKQWSGFGESEDDTPPSSG